MSQLPILVDPANFTAMTVHLSCQAEGLLWRLIRLLWDWDDCHCNPDKWWLMRRLRITEDEYDRLLVPLIDDFCVVDDLGLTLDDSFVARCLPTRDPADPDREFGVPLRQDNGSMA